MDRSILVWLNMSVGPWYLSFTDPLLIKYRGMERKARSEAKVRIRIRMRNASTQLHPSQSCILKRSHWTETSFNYSINTFKYFAPSQLDFHGASWTKNIGHHMIPIRSQIKAFYFHLERLKSCARNGRYKNEK